MKEQKPKQIINDICYGKYNVETFECRKCSNRFDCAEQKIRQQTALATLKEVYLLIKYPTLLKEYLEAEIQKLETK